MVSASSTSTMPVRSQWRLHRTEVDLEESIVSVPPHYERHPLLRDAAAPPRRRRSSATRPVEASRSPGALPELGADRPALVVAPLAVDLQVLLGEALAHEAAAADQRDRGRVPGLDVGLEPVQSELAEGVVEDEAHALGHVAAALQARDPAVADVRALQRAPHDLGDVEHAREPAVLTQADHERHERVVLGAPQQLIELGGGRRRRDPGSVKGAAARHRVEELVAIGGREGVQLHAHQWATSSRPSARFAVTTAIVPDVPRRSTRANTMPCTASTARPNPTASQIAVSSSSTSSEPSSSTAIEGTPASTSAASCRPMRRISARVRCSSVFTLWASACAYAWASQKTTVVTASSTATRVVSCGYAFPPATSTERTTIVP